jgi:CopG family nickel-responsive transcriptional regulator
MSDLSRFGVAMEASLLAQFDELVAERGSSRSELLRDLVRAEIVRSLARKRIDAYASVTIVYNHHVRELSEQLIEIQHELGEQVHSTMHVHLDHDRCLEVIVMRGRADKLQSAAEKLFATRGVLQGAIEVVAAAEPPPHTHAHGGREHSHPHRARGRAGQKPPSGPQT